MGNILLLFLVLFPMLLSAWVFPLRRRDRRYRNWLIQIIPAVELAAALLLLLWPGAALELPGVFGFGLRLQAGSLGSLLALVSAFLWAATGLNCPSYFAAAEGCNRFYFFWLLTLGALMGVFLAADLFTLFVFFEMMSFTSYVWVVQNETEEARQAGQTYLAVAVIGGMALLAGLIPEYLVCRFTRRKWWKVLPPLAVAAITALVTAGRLSVWESDVSPVTQLLFVPGVPAAFALLGTLLGWRLWKRLWGPRVVKDRRGG